MSSATTPVLAPSGNTAARPAPAERATTKSARERAGERERRARCGRRDVRCAAPCSRGRSASGTAPPRWKVGSLTRLLLRRRAPAPRTPRPLRPPASAATTRARGRSRVSSSARSTPSSPATRSNALRCSVSSPCLVRVARGRRARARAACPGRRDGAARCGRTDEIPAVREPGSAPSSEAPPSASASQKSEARRRCGTSATATGVKLEAPVEVVRLAQERCDAGAHLRERPRPAASSALIPYAGLPLGVR